MAGWSSMMQMRVGEEEGVLVIGSRDGEKEENDVSPEASGEPNQDLKQPSTSSAQNRRPGFWTSLYGQLSEKMILTGANAPPHTSTLQSRRVWTT